MFDNKINKRERTKLPTQQGHHECNQFFRVAHKTPNQVEPLERKDFEMQNVEENILKIHYKQQHINHYNFIM